jgi:type I restriction enzyme S subunit
MSLTSFLTHFDLLAEAPNAIHQLRALILQLAVQGKLVPQDPDDEPAAVLLERIQQWIVEKRVRKQKPFLDITENGDISIPSTWVNVRLGEIGDWGSGSTPDRSNAGYYGGKTSWFKSGELNDGYIHQSEETITELALEECSLRLNRPGDVLIAMYGATIGKTAILQVEATTNQAICACTCCSGVYNRYLLLFLKAHKHNFANMSAGAAQPNISREKIIHTLFPLPPLAEQHRIVAKVDQLMALCDRLEARQQERRAARLAYGNLAIERLLEARDPEELASGVRRLADSFDLLYDTPETVGRLRQAVLQLAVQGRLVPQDPRDEPVSIVLKKIRNQHIQKSYNIQEGLTQDTDLPLGWDRVQIADVSNHCLGKMLDQHKNKGKHLPYLRNINVRWLGFNLSDLLEMPFEDHELEKFSLKAGDVLICEGGEPGRAAVWTEQQSIIKFQKAVHRVRPLPILDSHFLVYRILSDARSGNLEKHFTGATIKHFTGRELAKYSFPLPPLAEQRRIVAKVDQFMALCDELEARLKQAQADSAALLEAMVSSLLVENGTPEPAEPA